MFMKIRGGNGIHAGEIMFSSFLAQQGNPFLSALSEVEWCPHTMCAGCFMCWLLVCSKTEATPLPAADPPSSSTSRGWASFLTGVGASPLFYVSIGALAAAAAVKGSADSSAVVLTLAGLPVVGLTNTLPSGWSTCSDTECIVMTEHKT